MDELAPLFQEIDFPERFRGYDPEAVDAYVDRVTTCAAQAQGRIAELGRRLESAEARTAGGGGGETEETLRGMLLLAQRTADAAVAEATEKAEALVAEAEARATEQLADADTRSSRMLAEAETDRRRIIAEAETSAARDAEERRVALEAEVADLARTRDFLHDDISILERHLREQRARLQAAVGTLADLVNAPDALRVEAAPVTSGVDPSDVEPVAASEPTAAWDVINGTPPAPTDESADGEARSDIGSADSGSADTETADTALEVSGSDGAGATGSRWDDTFAAEADAETDEAEVVEPVGFDDAQVATDGTEPAVDEPQPDLAPVAGVTGDSEGDHMGGPSSSPVIDLTEPDEAEASADGDDADAASSASERIVTAADLDGGDEPGPETDRADDASTTAPVPVVDQQLFGSGGGEADPFIDQLRDAVATEAEVDRDDAALSAFFDQDDEEITRSWFGRRR